MSQPPVDGYSACQQTLAMANRPAGPSRASHELCEGTRGSQPKQLHPGLGEWPGKRGRAWRFQTGQRGLLPLTLVWVECFQGPVALSLEMRRRRTPCSLPWSLLLPLSDGQAQGRMGLAVPAWWVLGLLLKQLGTIAAWWPPCRTAAPRAGVGPSGGG